MSDYEREMMLDAQRYRWLRDGASPRDEASLWVARGLPHVRGVSHWCGPDLDKAIDVEINEAMKPLDPKLHLIEALELIADMGALSTTVDDRCRAFDEAVSHAKYALSKLEGKP